MQQLASDVGGLQRVLTNVKTRGGWGEVQLGALLEQVLTPEQFARNVKTRDGSGETVEFAIKLPGDENGAPGLAADRREVSDRRLSAADRGAGDGRSRGDRGRDEEPGNAVEEKRERYLREIHQPAAHDRFRAHVSADGRTLRRSDPARRPGRAGAARLPGRVCRADHAGGVAQQFADGISHARHSEAIERSLEFARGGEE